MCIKNRFEETVQGGLEEWNKSLGWNKSLKECRI